MIKEKVYYLRSDGAAHVSVVALADHHRDALRRSQRRIRRSRSRREGHREECGHGGDARHQD